MSHGERHGRPRIAAPLHELERWPIISGAPRQLRRALLALGTSRWWLPAAARAGESCQQHDEPSPMTHEARLAQPRSEPLGLEADHAARCGSASRVSRRRWILCFFEYTVLMLMRIRRATSSGVRPSP